MTHRRHAHRRGRRALAVAAFLATTVGPVSAGAQGPQARAVLPGIEGLVLLDTMGLAFPMAGARDSIYAAFEKVFAELKIPVQVRNQNAGLLHNLNADISRRLGGEALSRYLDCGRGFSGNNADFYKITLAISAWVEPASGDPERIQVAVAASGRDPAGSRSYYSQCTSRGALEKRIAERVRQLAAPR